MSSGATQLNLKVCALRLEKQTQKACVIKWGNRVEIHRHSADRRNLTEDAINSQLWEM